MRRVNARNDRRMEVNVAQVDEVKEFVYPGALLDKEGEATEYTQKPTGFLQDAKNLGH